jgi:DNA-binding beta-propeller fold protein YncE
MEYNRRRFLKQSLFTGLALQISPLISIANRPNALIGHGDFKYQVDMNWGKLNASITPVNNCHEMVIDSKGKLYLLTDEPKNNVIIYDQSGKFLNSWTLGLAAAHGLTLSKEGEEEFLWITDNGGKVVKTTLNGRIIKEIPTAHELGIYSQAMRYVPTETAVAPNGDVYIADGYGSQFFLRFDYQGNFIQKFGGEGNQDHEFKTAHGLCIDSRNGQPTLICTSRGHNSFKRFSLEGDYLETLFLPGAFVCRPVIHGDELYSGVCWSRTKYLEPMDNSGFVTILDKNNKVISNPGGTAPQYENGTLQLMVQDQPIFKHCHDVCIDDDKNIYVCQWNASHSYPIKLTRV